MAYRSELDMQYPEYEFYKNPMLANEGGGGYIPETRSQLGEIQFGDTTQSNVTLGDSGLPSQANLDYGGNANYPSYDMGTGDEGFAGSVGGDGGGGGGANWMGMAKSAMGGLQGMMGGDKGGQQQPQPQGQQMTPEGMPLEAYDSNLQTYSSGLNAAGDVGLSSGNPYGMIAGAVAKVGAAGLSLYDKAAEKEHKKKNYQLMLDEYERRKRIAEEDKNRELRRDERREGYFGADYARNLGTELASDAKTYGQGDM